MKLSANALTRFFFICVVLFLLPTLVDAQNKLPLEITISTKEGNFKGSALVIKNKGTVRDSLVFKEKNLKEIKVTLSHNYTLLFKKPGYETKVVKVKGVVPSHVLKRHDSFDPVKFSVKLGKKRDTSSTDNTNYITYNFYKNRFEYEDIAAAKKKKNEIEKKKKKETYSKIVEKADSAFSKKAYKRALKLYKKAVDLGVEDKYAQEKVAEIQNIIQKRKTDKKKYERFLSKADSNYKAKNFEQAKRLYQKASNIYPNRQYPKQKIREAVRALSRIKENEERNKIAIYRDTINYADYMYARRNYSKALKAFKYAAKIIPSRPYPKNMIEKIQNTIHQKKKQKKELEKNTKWYNKTVKKGDKYFSNQQYKKAEDFYSRAINIDISMLGRDSAVAYRKKPGQKLQTIYRLLAKSKYEKKDSINLAKKVDTLITIGDEAYNLNNLRYAKRLYEKALEYDPDRKSLKNKLNKVTSELENTKHPGKESKGDTAKNLKQARYLKHIHAGESAINNLQYKTALTEFKAAHNIFPKRNYPVNKINRIQNILDNLAENEKQIKQRRKKYLVYINKGDSLLKKQNYLQAISAYKKAHTTIPDTRKAKEKISHAEIAYAKHNLRKSRKKEEKQLYKKFISRADSAFNESDYLLSRYYYNKAHNKMPDSSYAIKRLQKIKKKLRKKNAAEKQQNYNNYIQKADNAIKNKKFNLAKIYYNRALTIKPEADYPEKKFNQIRKKLKKEEQRKITAKYQKYIQKADNALDNEDFSVARFYYQKALDTKKKTYPQKKIQEINNKLSKINKENTP